VTNVYDVARKRNDEVLTEQTTNPSSPVYTLYADEIAQGVTQATVAVHRETQLGLAERGINERSSFLGVISEISAQMEFGSSF
jgi:hypothetical protein